MPFPIENKLVIAVTSTALFDLSEEHEIYIKKGVTEFRTYQRENRHKILQPGSAFPFIKGLLALNNVYDEKPIEVVLLSRNHPDAGLRVMDAIKENGLEVSRAFFLAGKEPFPYMKAANACLYLSTNKDEVKSAVDAGYPAGFVLPCENIERFSDDTQLRVAFDFDGVIVDDESEKIYDTTNNLDTFHMHEDLKKNVPLKEGPLMPLFKRLSKLQKLEREKAEKNPDYEQLLRIAVITARNAPAHERLIKNLSYLDIDIDEMFLLGGIEKKNILDVLKPQMFFDDQMGHLQPASGNTPSIHIPFGVKN